MISAKKLYKIIKQKYPDFQPPKARANDFRLPEKPPLGADQLELFDSGFPVKPSYDPRFYPDSRMDPQHVDEIIEAFSETEKQAQ